MTVSVGARRRDGGGRQCQGGEEQREGESPAESRHGAVPFLGAGSKRAGLARFGWYPQQKMCLLRVTAYERLPVDCH